MAWRTEQWQGGSRKGKEVVGRGYSNTISNTDTKRLHKAISLNNESVPEGVSCSKNNRAL